MDLQGEAARARDAAARLAKLQRKVAGVPGLADGQLRGLREALELLLRDYEGATPRQRRAFRRELDDVAARIGRAGAEGRIAPRHLRVLDQALLHARALHFANARAVLGRLDKPLALGEAARAALEEYRRARRALALEVEALRAERDRLRAIPPPPVDRPGIEGVAAAFARYNGAARELLDALLADPTSAGLRLLLEGSADPALGLPVPGEPAAALVAHLEGQPGLLASLGPGGARALLRAAQWSEAKLAHRAPDARSLRRLLQASLPWLQALASPDPRALGIPWGEDPAAAAGRLPSLAAFLARCPGGAAALAALGGLGEAVRSGAYGKALAAEALFRAYGEAAARRLDGRLDGELRALETRLREAEAILAGLPPPPAP